MQPSAVYLKFGDYYDVLFEYFNIKEEEYDPNALYPDMIVQGIQVFRVSVEDELKSPSNRVMICFDNISQYYKPVNER
jgi:hypothetical protein